MCVSVCMFITGWRLHFLINRNQIWYKAQLDHGAGHTRMVLTDFVT